MKILVTGAAGFIGFHLSKRLLQRGDTVIGLDNLNSYYDVSLKKDRLEQISSSKDFTFYQLDLADREQIEKLFSEQKFEVVVNLAAQAGVRYSITNPHAYADSNLTGFMNILEGCRHTNVGHLVFASSSSVYGANKKIPFAVEDNVDYPVSLYAATKKANELMAHSYSHLYNMPLTGLRFFTVYGPWGRPDMAVFLFTKAILAGEPIKVFNYGKMQRDFTYIDDLVEGIVRVIDNVPQPNTEAESNSKAPYKIYNIGNNKPVELLRMIEVLENCIGKQAVKEMLPMQPGDVPITYANVDALVQDVGFSPDTPIEVGIERFVEWYRTYYNC
ncbi:MAG: NAD-dependent epimerase [Limnoraphis robusta]|uniref:Capsular biosynthesis protein CpsI n=2 Tax=Limnoraphis robusta TaxID=1118279 RepID=A0A0F5YEW3_9CYAN|nr:NAD-dependent epimerase [Limnoraphis robusta]KKD37162.1 capsular biosynthesis protein CpsI [Limnoraphis robusta CS-951]KMW70091.1 capsular biosynthesis protein CpsI [Limnoraphis robusta CS-951]KMW70412.1 capsular biosynthesis protein CpsI [Limnoraphis robusta CS-951]MEA5500080.1 NAD-dependent epimerase [Limnoraphis robusta BA-68 BA1]MEA5521226.1 NAD-dependent epimerase [Limnoraphis robusta CCNP1315]